MTGMYSEVDDERLAEESGEGDRSEEHEALYEKDAGAQEKMNIEHSNEVPYAAKVKDR